MNKKSIIIILGLIILSVLLFLFFNKNEPATAVDFVNDKYGFALTLDEEFNENVVIKEEGQVFYFVSKEIQATQPDMIFGMVGRIEIYNKTEFTEETMMDSGEAYSLKYLGENDRYYFGWAHATDVQVPPGEESLTEKFRALEADFAEVIKTFKTMDALAPEAKTDTGSYVGLADNNFFEVKISGIPDDDKAYRVFMISGEVRSKFESLNLLEGEEIKLQYFENEHGQNVVEDINRIE